MFCFRESSAIPNKTAFQDLLCDLEVWHEAPGELLRSHLEHLYELVYESNEKKYNTWVMRDLGLVEKLLHITPDVKHAATRQVDLRNYYFFNFEFWLIFSGSVLAFKHSSGKSA